uniref:Uncharacterized protein n=1 Tax=Rhizophora mucronata TaxID=61149 RepID=A0A2P2PNK0_RHIMU
MQISKIQMQKSKKVQHSDPHIPYFLDSRRNLQIDQYASVIMIFWSQKVNSYHEAQRQIMIPAARWMPLGQPWYYKDIPI